MLRVKEEDGGLEDDSSCEGAGPSFGGGLGQGQVDQKLC